MIHVQETKRVVAVQPQLKNDGAFANNTYWDRSGFKHERIEIIVGETDAAVGSTTSGAAPKIEECDTAGGSYTDVSGAALSAAIAATDDNKVFGIDVDLRKTHKRYGRVNAPTAAAGTTGVNLAIICTLSMSDLTPKDAAGQGLAELVSA